MSRSAWMQLLRDRLGDPPPTNARRDLAAAVDTSISNVSRWYSHGYYPRPEVRVAVDRALGVRDGTVQSAIDASEVSQPDVAELRLRLRQLERVVAEALAMATGLGVELPAALQAFVAESA